MEPQTTRRPKQSKPVLNREISRGQQAHWKNGCTNFTEISYEKTRGSYDQSAIASGNQKSLPAHRSARFASVAARPALATGAPMSGQPADGQPSSIERPWITHGQFDYATAP